MNISILFFINTYIIRRILDSDVSVPSVIRRPIRAGMAGHNRMITADLRGYYSFKENKTSRNLLGELIIRLAIQ